METLKLGNIEFNVSAYKDVSFLEFEKDVKGRLQGYDLKKAYKKLTGRNPVIKKESDEQIVKPEKPLKKVRSKQSTK